MIISFDKMVRKYSLNIRGVIHIGAHYGQEYADYARHGVKDMLFFEPVLRTYAKLVEALPTDPRIKTFNTALGNESGVREMYIERANQGQSSSLLKPDLHLQYSPTITFNEKETVRIEKLDRIKFDRSLYNMINIDVQGFELEVFKGSVNTLPFIDIIYSEINCEELYTGCVQVEDLDQFLKQFGFSRVLTQMAHKSWGDALYLKNA